MIESFYIQNFKNFRELMLPELKRVNLIVGKNNVGKSTLLEALAIYVSNGDRSVIRTILEDRGINLSDRRIEQREYKEAMLSLFSDWTESYSKDYGITFSEAGKPGVTLQQVLLEEREDEEGTAIPRLMTYYSEDADGADYIDLSMKGLVVSNPKKSYLIRYSNPFMAVGSKASSPIVRTWEFNNSRNASLYDSVALSPYETDVIKALNLINPDIERISFVGESPESLRRVPVVSLKSSGRRVRLSSMGEGVNHILSIILSILSAENKVLLIDEFETGLHYSVQKQLWDIINMLASKLNIQVFVTTHSSDCLKSFALANKEQQGLLIRLEQRNAGIVPVLYTDNKDILFAADNNIELR